MYNNSSKKVLDYSCTPGKIIHASDDAIYCLNSSLYIVGEHSVFAYNYAQEDGGAISTLGGINVIRASNILFEMNVATHAGGAMFLYTVFFELA